MAKKVMVNQDTCIGCGSCPIAAPKTFVMDDSSGKAKVINSQGDPENMIQEAMEGCPVGAITYQD